MGADPRNKKKNPERALWVLSGFETFSSEF